MDKLNRRSKHKRGFLTLEILIAMAVIILALGSVLLVSAGNQSLLVDSEISRDALNLAEQSIENEEALASKDFKLVNPSTTSIAIDPITYTKEISVTTEPDFFTKMVTAKISWAGTFGRTQNITLNTLLTDFKNVVSGDTCNSNLTGNWTNSSIKTTKQITDQVTDIDAYENKLYVTTNNSSANNPTFHIYSIDTSDPDDPELNLDNEIDNDTNNTGLNALAIESNSFGSYAYVASASSFSKGQMQVIDLGGSLPTILKTYKIPTSLVSGTGVGNSIFYKNNYVYLGLTKTGSGPEFNIIDVSNPSSPFWVGGYAVGNDINTIYVNGNYAYLGTPNSQELITLNISDPYNTYKVGGYNSPTGSGNGKSMYLVGDTLYLGKTTGVGFDFHILDNTNPATNLSQLGGVDIGNGNSINGLIIRDYLAFMLTNTNFQILNIKDPSTITSYITPITLPSGTGKAMDCEGNNMFVGTSTGAVYIISS